MIRRIRDEMLAIYLADNVKARRMLPSGAYVRKALGDGSKRVNSQEWLLNKRRSPAEKPKNGRSRRIGSD